jgi:DNA repair protein RecN (Recombination protein N)
MTLKRITLRDFAIVRELDLEIDDGFTVLTGETGAGKSILIDALQMALGARADVMVVREGMTRAEVSVEFDQLSKDACAALHEAGFEYEDTLLLRRTVDAQGKSRAWINGSTATAQQLRSIGELLIDIYGQHSWHGLTRSENVRAIVDTYAKISLPPMQKCWDAWQAAKHVFEQATQSQEQLRDQRERLLWQIGELKKLSPKVDEWNELNALHHRLSHAQSLLNCAHFCVDVLDDAETNAIGLLAQASNRLQLLENIEPDFSGFHKLLIDAQAQTQETSRELRRYLDRTEDDPTQLAKLDDRLTLWISLARQFRQTPEDLPLLFTQWQDDLIRIEQSFDLKALEESVQSTYTNYQKEALNISRQREKFTPELAAAITENMHKLGMKGGSFSIELPPLEAPTRYGLESVDFLFAGHAGNTPRQLSKIASGGELSRIALAIAVCSIQAEGATTLIFDEVDSGIGGSVAKIVGQLMRQLGFVHQVLTVTHLPQVAAFANSHLQVHKKIESDRTVSAVTKLTREDRVQELARMLSGDDQSAVTLAHAEELLSSVA